MANAVRGLLFFGFIFCSVQGLARRPLSPEEWKLCEPAISQDYLKSLQSYLGVSNAHPYQYACLEGKLIPKKKRKSDQFVPDKRFKVTEQGVAAFRKDLIANIKKDVSLLRSINTQLQTCFQPKQIGCGEVEKTYLEQLKLAAKVARRNLALIHAGNEKNGISSLVPSSASESVGAFKAHPWAEFSEEELLDARLIMEGVDRDAKAAFNKVHSTDNLAEKADKTDWETKARTAEIVGKASENYRLIMGNFIVLHFVKSADPTGQELMEASQEVSRRLNAEEAHLQKIEDKMKNGQLIDEFDPYLIGYSATVEKTLMMHPEHCQIAQLMWSKKYREQEVKDGAMMLGLTASMVLSGGASVLVGGLISGVWIWDSDQRFREVLQHRQASWGAELATVSQPDVDAALSERNLNVVTTAIPFAASKVVRGLKGAVPVFQQTTALEKSGRSALGRLIQKVSK